MLAETKPLVLNSRNSMFDAKLVLWYFCSKVAGAACSRPVDSTYSLFALLIVIIFSMVLAQRPDMTLLRLW